MTISPNELVVTSATSYHGRTGSYPRRLQRLGFCGPTNLFRSHPQDGRGTASMISVRVGKRDVCTSYGEASRQILGECRKSLALSLVAYCKY